MEGNAQSGVTLHWERDGLAGWPSSWLYAFSTLSLQVQQHHDLAYRTEMTRLMQTVISHVAHDDIGMPATGGYEYLGMGKHPPHGHPMMVLARTMLQFLVKRLRVVRLHFQYYDIHVPLHYVCHTRTFDGKHWKPRELPTEDLRIAFYAGLTRRARELYVQFDQTMNRHDVVSMAVIGARGAVGSKRRVEIHIRCNGAPTDPPRIIDGDSYRTRFVWLLLRVTTAYGFLPLPSDVTGLVIQYMD